MVNITFIDADGNSFTVDAAVTSTLMETAIANEIPSIVGFCGGMCSCGTCHCYPEGEAAARLPAISENEEEMLGRVLDRRPASRLGCQIPVNASLDGLTVRLPSRQRVP